MTTQYYEKQRQDRCRKLADDYNESLVKMTNNINRRAMLELALQDAYLAGVEDVLADACKNSPPEPGAVKAVPASAPATADAPSAAPAARYVRGRKIS